MYPVIITIQSQIHCLPSLSFFLPHPCLQVLKNQRSLLLEKKTPTTTAARAKTKAATAPTKAKSTNSTLAKASSVTKKAIPKQKGSKQMAPKKHTVQKTSHVLNLSAKTFWPKTTELVSLEFSLRPLADCQLYPQYTIGLHAWFLHQIRDFDPELSAYLHNGESEKPFSLTGLNGQFTSHSQSLQLKAENAYQWRLNSLSGRVTQGIATWLKQLPQTLELQGAPLTIEAVQLAHPATTYTKLLNQGKAQQIEAKAVSLSFTSPTSFRRKGHHLPLPWPKNVFHSYLRRWNHFARTPTEPTDFLDWIDDHVIIQSHQLASLKVVAGKQGSVTGFTGSITYALDRLAAERPDYVAMFLCAL